MPLLSNVGRKAPAARLLLAAIYILLSAGAVTMVYPFLIMMSGSFKSNVDRTDFDIVPAFFHNDTTLYRKHLECKYNNSLTKYCPANRVKANDFAMINPPDSFSQQRVSDWKEFEASFKMPAGWYNLGYMTHAGDRLLLRKQREFRARLMELSGDSIKQFNAKFDTHTESWLAIGGIVERLTERRYKLSRSPIEQEFYSFKAEQPAWFRFYDSLDGTFVQTFLEPTYGRNIKEYNKVHGTSFASYRDITLSRTAPAGTLERKDWEHFVREELNLQYIRISQEAKPIFSQFLLARYINKLPELNVHYKASYSSFDSVPYPEDLLHSSDILVDWSEFIQQVPVYYISLTGPDIEFRNFLKNKYKDSIEALNLAHNSRHTSLEVVPMPVRETDYSDFLANRNEIRREFISANYKQVFEYIFMHGQALRNTVIYCVLAVLFALIVNPIAAYALSRYKLPSTYKILLFCMATMAFPPAVAMIPNFLLIKNLNMLNTFAALILPGVANGFNIFLLKGFFDSLPRELYESAELDGAGEWTIFWQITMSLSKPILAVMALGAFTAAYGNFMFAFILCPDERMWTIMVFLYQLQIEGHMALTFAALLIAAIPMFIAFVLCQKVIMQGIVVPVEK